MKRNKIAIIICVALLLLMFGQLIYFNNIGNNFNNIANETNYNSTIKSRELISNIDALYKYYTEINISKEKLEEKVYKLISQDFKYIVSNTKNNNATKNMQFYINNEEYIRSIGIMSAEDFALIAEDLKNTLKRDDILANKIEIDANNYDGTDSNNSNNFQFDIIITYSNDSKIKIKSSIPFNRATKNSGQQEEDIRINYASSSKLAQLYSNYNGSVALADTIDLINNYINNMSTLNNNTKLTSINSQKQYFENNKDVFNSLGIQSADDFVKVIYEINNGVTWSKNSEFINYTIETNSKQENPNYISFSIYFNYNYSEQIKITVNLAKDNNTLPRIRVTGQNGDL